MDACCLNCKAHFLAIIILLRMPFILAPAHSSLSRTVVVAIAIAVAVAVAVVEPVEFDVKYQPPSRLNTSTIELVLRAESPPAN